MRLPEDAVADVVRRLRTTWSQVVSGATWSPRFGLGTSGLTTRALEEGWASTHRAALRWVDWCASAGPGVRLERRAVRVHGTPQAIPAVLVVETIDVAARLAGPAWSDCLARARSRYALLASRFPALDDPAAVLRATDGYGDVDFDLLCRAAAWFAAPHPSGLTARQVPVRGLGTKWLASHDAAVRRLAGLDSLGLEPGRPAHVHLTYLDPTHLAAGGRRHDVATAGDVDALAYRPRTVVISENRDTAQLFPPVPEAIAIEGDGRGAGAVAALSWVREAPTLSYWGDMDADGLEILHAHRAAGLAVRSLFMDVAAYDRWEEFGVDHDHHGAALGPRRPRDVGRLEPGERDLYLALCSPSWPRHRRIEQERLPLDEAVAVVRSS